MRLFVGNISWNVDEQELSDHMGKCGSVKSCSIKRDRETDRSRGFAFVEYVEDKHARVALDELHDSELDGRRLAISEARPRDMSRN